MRDVIKILNNVINNNDYVIDIDSVEKLNDTQFKLIIDSCDLSKNNTLWLRECLILTIDDNKYKVVELGEEDDDVYFILEKMKSSTPDLENVTEIVLNKPTFIHGTVPASNIEISQDCIDMPIIYLYEIFENNKQSLESNLDTIAFNLRLFFLSDYDDEWLTTDHYNNVIYQMQNLMFLFVENLKKDSYIDDDYILRNAYKYYNRSKLGSFKGNKGNEKGLFDRKLSGVELVINLPIKKVNNCKC